MKSKKVIEKKLGRHKAYGIVNEPGYPKDKIYIDPRQRPKQFLGVMIHEALHLAYPEMSETQIRKGESILRDVLWANNVRQVKQ